ncbi:MAG: ribonuclease D [Pseudomonadota bacterium]
MKAITTTDALQTACNALAASPYVTVDTEFMRESTFWPILCLIQMASDDTEVLVDPLAEGLDLAPFFALMANPDVTKVFHAARQDVEIIHHHAGIIPTPLVDTQVAAMVCGFGDSIGYANLAKQICNVDIDKSSRFTDWARRPLSEKQLVYALADVTHLRIIYKHLEKLLAKSGRRHWLSEEMDILTDPSTYESDPAQAWKRLKAKVKSRKAMAVLMELAAWREEEVQRKDVPRNRVLRDEVIYDVANQAPTSETQLAKLRTISEGFARSRTGKDVLAAVQRGLDRDPETVPSIKRGAPPPPQASAIVDLLRVHLKAVSANNDVAAKLIATTDDLERIAIEDEADVPALRGWRRELFGEDALAIKRGDLGLVVRNGSVGTVEA